MLENIIQNVILQMSDTLDREQLTHLSNVLYMNFHNLELVETSYEITETGISGNEFKVKMFVAAKIANNLSKRTTEQYVRELKNFFTVIDKDIELITAMDIRFYISQCMEKKKNSITTINNRLHYLNSFFDFLTSEGVVQTNPVRKVGIIKQEKVMKESFSSEEMEKLRDVCTNTRDRALIEFLYSTGVRVSELVALDINDVRFNSSDLIVFGKGKKERRTYITDTAKFHLIRYLQERSEAKELDVTEPLFASLDYRRHRLTKSGVEHIVREIGKKAGVKAHPHKFRRTIATDLINRGMPIEQVSLFMGHNRLDTTMIYYAAKDETVKASHRKYAF